MKYLYQQIGQFVPAFTASMLAIHIGRTDPILALNIVHSLIHNILSHVCAKLKCNGECMAICTSCISLLLWKVVLKDEATAAWLLWASLVPLRVSYVRVLI